MHVLEHTVDWHSIVYNSRQDAAFLLSRGFYVAYNMAVAFRIVRLARPGIVRENTPLLLDLNEDLSTAYQDGAAGLEQSPTAVRVQLQNPSDVLGISPLLELPQHVTNVYLGEVRCSQARQATLEINAAVNLKQPDSYVHACGSALYATLGLRVAQLLR